MNSFQASKIKKILVINFGGIGDILLSTPALRALKKAYPGTMLYLLVTRRARSLVESLTYVDQVFCLEVINPWIYGWYNIRSLLKLRKEAVDLAVNMRTLVSQKSALKIRMVLKLINPKIKAGRDTAGRGTFFDLSIPEENVGTQCEIDYDIAITEALGGRVDDRKIDFRLSRESLTALKDRLIDLGIKDTDILVGIHPGGRPSRRWPAENFAAAIQEINRQINCVFVITGGKEEYNLARKIIKQSKVCAINLAGNLSLEALGALLNRLSLYISNDTGPMHIAAMLKTPLVAILGPGCFSRYNPATLSSEVAVLYKPTDCSPCNKFYCGSLACLRKITVEEVVEAALKFLKQNQRK